MTYPDELNHADKKLAIPEYPLIKELGLKPAGVPGYLCVGADDLERVLEKGVRGTLDANPALFIPIKPIKQPDTLEQLAKDLSNFHHDLGGLQDLIERAKELSK